MNQAFRLKMAKQKGESLLRELEIVSLPVDPFSVAANHDIVVKKKTDTDEGVSGMLLRHGDSFGIVYATHIPNEGFQRFSVAHELGHYFLDGHIDHVLPRDGVHASQAGFVSGDPFELEADHFAAGFLMPSTLFRRELGKYDPGLAAVEHLSEKCKTSLTATAIRYAELSEDAVAVVVSTGNSINYCCLSETMKSLKQITWLKKNSPIPPNTTTAQFNDNPDRVTRAERADSEIDILDWLGGVRSVPATEEVVGLGSYGKTLTVLTCESVVDETYRDEVEDDEDEDELIESWTPRFKR